MSCKTILAAASGGAASSGAIELACHLAKQFKAHIEGYHVRNDPRDIVMAIGDPSAGAIIGELMDKIATEAAANAAKTKVAFDAAIARHGIAAGTKAAGAASATWRDEIGHAPMLVARRARFFDLAVLGRSNRVVDQPHSDAVEQTLLHSGRPVLLAPAEMPTAIGETVALGWNGSPEAVRAMVGALPFLSAARAVHVIDVGRPDRPSATDVIEYLAWHGVAAKRRHVEPISGVGAGEQLLASARDVGADMLVMGGYGHTPWREFLFSGATHQIVGVSLLPILLSH
jgi:nucleotide-binding universal stress UspA family protein